MFKGRNNFVSLSDRSFFLLLMMLIQRQTAAQSGKEKDQTNSGPRFCANSKEFCCFRFFFTSREFTPR